MYLRWQHRRVGTSLTSLRSINHHWFEQGPDMTLRPNHYACKQTLLDEIMCACIDHVDEFGARLIRPCYPWYLEYANRYCLNTTSAAGLPAKIIIHNYSGWCGSAIDSQAGAAPGASSWSPRHWFFFFLIEKSLSRQYNEQTSMKQRQTRIASTNKFMNRGKRIAKKSWRDFSWWQEVVFGQYTERTASYIIH